MKVDDALVRVLKTDISCGTVLLGDAHDLFKLLPKFSVDLIITSPPYWGLRDYEANHNWDIYKEWLHEGHGKEELPTYQWFRDHGGLLGLEPLPEWYISNIVSIFDQALPALKPSGSLWLNLGDTYFARWSSIRPKGRQGLSGEHRYRRRTPMGGFRQEKQLLLIPTRVAIAMQERRWILRNDLIWYKPNVPPMPFEDRLALTHEHFFHFVRRPTEGRAKYYYDLSAAGHPAHDVQKVLVARGKSGHSATFPKEIIEPRILSSSPKGGVIVDPFCGTGTALGVALEHHRRAVGFEKNKRYVAIAQDNIAQITPYLFR